MGQSAFAANRQMRMSFASDVVWRLKSFANQQSSVLGQMQASPRGIYFKRHCPPIVLGFRNERKNIRNMSKDDFSNSICLREDD